MSPGSSSQPSLMGGPRPHSVHRERLGCGEDVRSNGQAAVLEIPCPPQPALRSRSPVLLQEGLHVKPALLTRLNILTVPSDVPPEFRIALVHGANHEVSEVSRLVSTRGLEVSSEVHPVQPPLIDLHEDPDCEGEEEGRDDPQVHQEPVYVIEELLPRDVPFKSHDPVKLVFLTFSGKLIQHTSLSHFSSTDTHRRCGLLFSR
mmetsp:Transcript_17146/g.34766  ORF Transcript_17146/g.34766 Transcript_17146/m.34766 type:complete len:203 (+) Transcript_17146:1380-1988(+)